MSRPHRHLHALLAASALCATLGACFQQPIDRNPSGPAPDPRSAPPTIRLTDGSAPRADAGVVPPAPPRPGADQGVAPPPPPPPPPPPRPDASVPRPDTAPGNNGVTLSAAERDLMDAVNAARAKKGLTTLAPDAQLMCAARDAAKVIPGTGNCGHVGTDGSWPHHRAKRCGMSDAASWKVNEIAAGPGFRDGADAVWGWSQSSGHWWGLVHPQARKIGVAVTSAGCFWVVFDCCIKGS